MEIGNLKPSAILFNEPATNIIKSLKTISSSFDFPVIVRSKYLCNDPGRGKTVYSIKWYSKYCKINLQSYAPPLCARIVLPRKIGSDNNSSINSLTVEKQPR